MRAAATTVPGAIFMFFACFYTLTYQGRVNTYDGQSMFATTRALGDHLSLALTNQALGVVGRNGRAYAKYGIGQSIAELPLYLVGKLLGGLAGSKGPQVAEMLAMLANPLLMALSCAAFYGVVRALGYTRTTGIAAALVLGIATSLWPYSKSDFSEPLLTLSLLTAALAVLLSSRAEMPARRVVRLDALAGVALGAAMLAKYAALLYVPVFCLYLVLASPRGRTLAGWARRFAALLAPVFVAGCIVLLVNDLRFGSIFTTGYAANERPFTTPLVRGLWGSLLSPYRGLLVYDPLLFVGMLCLPLLVWWRPRVAILPVGIFIVSVALYGAYVGWDAGPAWGPRYFVPTIQFLLWPLLELGCFGPAEAPRTTVLVSGMAAAVRRWATIALVGVSAAVQALGVSMNYYVHDMYWQVGTPGVSFVALKSSLAASPLAMALWTLPMNLRYALTGSLPRSGYASSQYPWGPPFPTHPHMPAALGAFFAQTFWFTLLPHPALVALAGTVVLGAGMFLGGRVLWRAARGPRAIPAQQEEAVPVTVGQAGWQGRSTTGASV